MATERTTAGLRDGLFQMFDDLRSGAITPQDAVAGSKIAAQINSLIKTDMDYVRFSSEQRSKKEKIVAIPSINLV